MKTFPELTLAGNKKYLLKTFNEVENILANIKIRLKNFKLLISFLIFRNFTLIIINLVILESLFYLTPVNCVCRSSRGGGPLSGPSSPSSPTPARCSQLSTCEIILQTSFCSLNHPVLALWLGLKGEMICTFIF